MSPSSKALTIGQARRIALAAQGFNDPRPARVTARQFRRLMDRMTILQLDSVNVLCRSHYLPALARLGPYDRERFDHYLYHSGEQWEYIAHEASLTSQAHHRLLRYRMDEARWRRAAQLEADQPEYVEAVRQEVAEHGPLSIKQLSDPGKRTGPWWGMPKGKLALERLYLTGRLSVRERNQQFITFYDLPERVLEASALAEPTVDEGDAIRELLVLGARSHGVGTAADLADYFRIKMPKARPALEDLVAEGRLEKVAVQGWNDDAYLHPEAARPRSVSARALLSPFDPVVWFRPRGVRLFDFAYKIEIYVPEPKRIYGYYVLPFLLGEELVGRVDLKADRKAGVLLAKAVHAQTSVTESGRTGRTEEVAAALAETLLEMAQWLGLDGVEVGDRGDLAPQTAAAVQALGA